MRTMMSINCSTRTGLFSGASPTSWPVTRRPSTLEAFRSVVRRRLSCDAAPIPSHACPVRPTSMGGGYAQMLSGVPSEEGRILACSPAAVWQFVTSPLVVAVICSRSQLRRFRHNRIFC